MTRFATLSAPMLAALLGEGGKSVKGSKARGGKKPRNAKTQPLEPSGKKKALRTADR